MSRPSTRFDFGLYAACAGAEVALHVATAGRYGMFRDEYYYLACADRLDWGYVDHPPLSILVLAISRALLGDSVLATRLPAILAAAAVVVVAGLLTRRLGGGRFAQGLAMLCVVACPMLLGIHSLYSMNSFDHLFWVLGAYVLVGIIQTDDPRRWLLLGLVSGLGLQNKTSMAFFAIGLVAGLALTSQRKWFRSPYLYAGGALALLIYAPNIAWQVQHDFAMLEFIRNASLHKNAPITPVSYVLEIVKTFHPLLLPVWLMGALYPFVRSEARVWRPLALVFVTVLIVFMFTNGKPYYAAPAFALIFPLGALWIERLTTERRSWRPAIVVVLVIGGALFVPMAIPILPPQKALTYMQTIGIIPKPAERGHSGEMPQHFADRFGWRKRAELVKRAYDSLSPEDRKKAVILCPNYGEAAAMEYYAAELGLPPAISGHNNYWLWGPGQAGGEVNIVIAHPDNEMLRAFRAVEDLGTVDEPFQLDRWRELRVYIARGLERPVAELWPDLKRFI